MCVVVKYMGSKARLAKQILPIILKDRQQGQWYVEPFGGGANSICEVDNPRLYNDFNHFLSIFFKEAVAGVFIPPESIDRDLYNWARKQYQIGGTEHTALIGYIGVNGSYGGRWFDGGYAGVTTTKQGKERNYPLEAYNNVMEQLPKLEGCVFKYGDYKELSIPENSIIYCDPPYRGTKEYKSAKKSGFDSDEFWGWCRERSKDGHQVYISEYTAPDDFVCLWEKEVSSSLRSNGVISGDKKSVEKLFTYITDYER